VLGIYNKRCLHKDHKQRIRDIGDVFLALDGAFDAPHLTGCRALGEVGGCPELWNRESKLLVELDGQLSAREILVSLKA
jgi:hypothetical protein